MEATPAPTPADDPPGRSARGRYERGTIEFDRIVNFNDAVYAIALTLLVVTIEVPRIPDATDRRELLRALNDLRPQIISFFVSFAVIGNFWLAHHRFVDRLGAIDRPLLRANLLYLAFVAIVPFPAGVLGEYDDNAVAVIVYALTMAAVSSLETLMLWVAWRGELFRRAVSAPILRYGLAASLIPVGLFMVSIPIALVEPLLGIVTWFLAFPCEALLDRRWRPPGAKEVFS